MPLWAILLVAPLGAALALIALALVLPLRLWLSLDTGAERVLSLAVQPVSRVFPRFSLPTGRKTEQAPEKTKKKAKKKRRGRMRFRLRPGAVPRLIGGLLGAVHLEEARLDLAFGLGDPGETGQVFGLLCPLIYGSAGAGRVRLTVEPVFDRLCLEGSGALCLRLRPGAVLWPLARFGWSLWGAGR